MSCWADEGLLRTRPLRGKPLARLGGRKPARASQAVHLQIFRSRDHHDLVKPVPPATLQNQGGLYDADSCAGRLRRADLPPACFSNCRMHDGLQASPGRGIGEYQLAESTAIDPTCPVQDPGPEGFRNLPVAGLAGLLEGVGDPVGVDGGRPARGKHSRDGGFARSDSAGQAH